MLSDRHLDQYKHTVPQRFRYNTNTSILIACYKLGQSLGFFPISSEKREIDFTWDTKIVATFIIPHQQLCIRLCIRC